MLWRPPSCYTASLFDGHLSEMTEEEFGLWREQRSSFCLLMWCILCREGQGEEALLPNPLFHSLKQLGIFYLCHHSYQHECTHISTLTKITETCILPAIPTISLSGVIITRYSKEIPWLKRWYIILHYPLL